MDKKFKIKRNTKTFKNNNAEEDLKYSLITNSSSCTLKKASSNSSSNEGKNFN